MRSPRLEKELRWHRRFKSKAEAKMAVFEWIEGWYNPHRRYSSIGRLAPNNFEKQLTVSNESRI
ncbi:MAG: IS3 family transposase [Proteobacteria bacterium]|nr:IS3 family transposase [Pseudomonadota bacterium]